MTDPISDMLTRIRNAQAVFKKTVDVPFSKLKFDLAELLAKNGYFSGVWKNGSGLKQTIVLALKYDKKRPFIKNISRVSRPGQRIYIKGNEIYPVLNGYGISVISTSRGLMINMEAKKNKLGGEIICEIW